MTKEVLILALETAELHANRLRFAITQLRQIVPISGEAFAHLSIQDLLLFELFTSRFAKLQDLMGGKIFGLVLEQAKEVGSFNTFLDKLHALEKMEIILDGEKWIQMRALRNLISHEYPDDPEKGAKNFNEAFEMAPYLLECLENTHCLIKNRTIIGVLPQKKSYFCMTYKNEESFYARSNKSTITQGISSAYS